MYWTRKNESRKCLLNWMTKWREVAPATLVLLLLMVFCLPVHGTIYKYRDAQGNIGYTDNILEVPADQRKKVTEYQSYESSSGATSNDASEGDEVDKPPEKETTGVPSDLKKEEQRLRKVQDDLTKEREALIAEREKVRARGKKNIANIAVKQQIKKKIEALNQRISQYDQKSRQFQEDLKAYNAKALQ